MERARAPNGEGRCAATTSSSGIYRVRFWGARVGKTWRTAELPAGTSLKCLLGHLEPGFGSVVGDRAESRLKAILPRYRRGAGGELENHPIALPHDNAGLPHA